MITFNGIGKTYGIQFSHELRDVEIERNGEVWSEPRRTTIASVVLVGEKEGKPTYEVVQEGYSVCHPNDVFVKEQGRKVALQYALQGFAKQFRTLAWEAYHSR